MNYAVFLIEIEAILNIRYSTFDIIRAIEYSTKKSKDNFRTHK